MATTNKANASKSSHIDPKKLKAVNKAIEAINSKLEKRHEEPAVTLYGADTNANIDVIHEPTGSIALDYITGGGLARGRVHEFYGPEGSGKTSVALQAVAQIQRKGGVAAFIDVEHALNPQQATKLGVDMSSLILSQPSYGEQALDIMIALIESNVVDIIILDSVAALVPKAELDGDIADRQIGPAAAMMSKALRIMIAAASKNGTIVVFINQVRDAIGSYGSPEVTPGGKALKFYCSVRVRISKGQAITDSKTKQAIGQKVFLRCKKNKVGRPFLNAETEFYFNSGMDAAYDIAAYGTSPAIGVIKKSGRNYIGLDGQPLMWNGQPITKKETLAQALHSKKSGLLEMFYQPTVEAMQRSLQEALDGEPDEDDEEDAEDVDQLMDALDGTPDTIEEEETEDAQEFEETEEDDTED